MPKGSGPRCCALTSPRSTDGKRKPLGECALTRAALDGKKDTSIRYTVCDHCQATLCCSCLDAVAAVATDHAERICFNIVWSALLARPWRVGSDAVRGFEQRAGGGGTWRSR